MDQAILDLMHGMSPEQERAASEFADPVLIVAGAGSGKTRTLVGRLAKILLPQQFGGMGESPDSVMMVTFTNKAARETISRIQPLMDALQEGGHIRAGEKVWAGTFHSLSLRILRLEASKAGFGKNFSIYDDSDAESLIKEISADDDAFDIDSFRRCLEIAKANLLSPEFIERAAVNNELGERVKMLADESFRRHYGTYQRMLKEQGAVDFSDLLNHVTTLFRDTPEVRARWQARFRHFMVDEVQDANRAQIQWLAALTNGGKASVPGDLVWEDEFCSDRVRRTPKPSLAFVGDDDQAIYGFRGSDDTVLRGMRGRFPGIKVRALQTSYRCQPYILGVAHKLVKDNTGRIPKEMEAHPSTGEGRRLTIEQLTDADDETKRIIARIKDMPDGELFSDHAVLLRTRKLAQRFAKSLRLANVPVQEGASSDVMKSAEVKDTLAFAGYLVNPDSEVYLRRIINKPARGLGPTSIMKAAANARLNQRSLSQELKMIAAGKINIPEGGQAYGKAFIDSVRHFMALCSELRGKLGLDTGMGDSLADGLSRLADPLSQSVLAEDGAVPDAGAALTLILSASGYLEDLRSKVLKANGRAAPASPEHLAPAGFVKWINGGKHAEQDASDLDDGDGASGRGVESVRRLSNLGVIIEKAKAFGGLESFTQEVSLDYEQGDKEEPNAVRVLTLHGSKGLEFKHVYLPCWVEGVLPSGRSLSETDNGSVDEERRLAYVGITRGAKTVHLSYSFGRLPEVGIMRDCKPSRFIDEIRDQSADLVEFKGRKIERSNFAFGRNRRPENDPDRLAALARQAPASATAPVASTSFANAGYRPTSPQLASSGRLVRRPQAERPVAADEDNLTP